MLFRKIWRLPLFLGLHFLIFLPPAWGFHFFFSHGELGTNVTFEYNRVFTNCFEVETYGGLEFGSFLGIQGGLSAGAMGTVPDFNAFTRLEMQPLFWLPITLSLNYIHNNIPDYKTSIHSIIPYISWNGKRAGLSLGSNFRYTLYGNEAPVFESIFVFSLYLNIINSRRVNVGVKYANFNNFLSGNMGSYSLILYNYIHLTGIISLRNEVELHQTGSVGLAANFYGVSYKGGVVFQW
jgi:hypothetical protein